MNAANLGLVGFFVLVGGLVAIVVPLGVAGFVPVEFGHSAFDQPASGPNWRAIPALAALVGGTYWFVTWYVERETRPRKQR